MSLRVPVTVEMDDGRKVTVVADQRDFAAAEGADLDRRSQVHTWVRYIAFNAMVRTKQYAGAWQEFNTRDCVEATDVMEESDDTEDGLDPGRKVPGDGN